MKRCLRWTVLVLLILCLSGSCGACVAIDAMRVSEYQSRITLIEDGQSKATVEEIMGEPTSSYFVHAGIFWSDKLLYGSRYDWDDALRGDFPYFWPFRDPFSFSPNEDDIVISFNRKGEVFLIRLPE